MQANTNGEIPVELRLANAKRLKLQGFARVGLTCAFRLKWVWWHARSYVPIVVVLVLSLGSLLILQLHWLYRRLSDTPTRAKAILKDAG